VIISPVNTAYFLSLFFVVMCTGGLVREDVWNCFMCPIQLLYTLILAYVVILFTIILVNSSTYEDGKVTVHFNDFTFTADELWVALGVLALLSLIFVFFKFITRRRMLVEPTRTAAEKSLSEEEKRRADDHV